MMHSPGHSSAASTAESMSESGMRATPRPPSGPWPAPSAPSKITAVPKCFASSLTTHNPSSRAVKTSPQISSQMPSPVQRS
jgi:hypothetical protein